MPESKSDSGLVDIRGVSVDSSLPKTQRITEFVLQIKDPYRFKCGKYTVTAKYNPNGPTMEECLQMIMA